MKKELVKICPQFDGYEMQDAHEFLISLLDAIKEEQTPKKPEGTPDEIPKVEEDPAEEVQVWSHMFGTYRQKFTANPKKLKLTANVKKPQEFSLKTQHNSPIYDECQTQ